MYVLFVYEITYQKMSLKNREKRKIQDSLLVSIYYNYEFYYKLRRLYQGLALHNFLYGRCYHKINALCEHSSTIKHLNNIRKFVFYVVNL